MHITEHTTDLIALAHRIDTDGLAACEPELADVAAQARTAGAPPILAEILLDPTQPAVARERAFLRLASQLDSHHRPGPPTPRPACSPRRTRHGRRARSLLLSGRA